MKFSKSILIILIALVLGIVSPSFSQNPEKLFQKGLIKEEGEGSLLEAIDLFKIIVETKNAEGALRAKALLHVGLCYEKLGKQEALKAYRRLIKDYPGQKNEVATARERLAGLVPATKKTSNTPLIPKFMKIKIPTKPGNGVLSPDGKKLAYVSEKSLWVLPVHGKTNPEIAGEPIRLTEPLGAWDLANMGTVWSANGKWLAFYVSVPGEDNIYIVPANGGKQRMVTLNQQRHDIRGYDYRMSLSPDGKILAFVNCNDNKETVIYSISTEGGNPTQLTGPGTREPAFSPDGKLLVYVKVNPLNQMRNEIWIIPSIGGNPILVSDYADTKKSPIWSPDGSMIAFLARKYKKGWANNSNELWIVSVDKNGEPKDLPVKVDLEYSTTSMLAGWNEDNKIGIWLSTPDKNLLYTVPASGGQAMQVTPKDSWMPDWSPDGKYLYFDGENTNDFAGLEYIPVNGGNAGRIPISSEYLQQPAMPTGGISVSLDGKNIVYSSFARGITDTALLKKLKGSHIMTIPVTGGNPFMLTINPESDRYPVWSPDGKSIAFIRIETKTENNIPATSANIYTIPANGGTPKKITSDFDKVTNGRIDWSPDGKWIGYFSADNTIKIISPAGGNSRVVVKDVSNHPHYGLSFSPKGSKIVYSTKKKLIAIDIEGKNETEVETGLDGIPTMPTWSPDGKKIAFSTYNKGETDLWLMENFLPLDKLQTKIQKIKITPKFTKIKIPTKLSWSVKLSPDGKELAFVSDKKLWKMPLSGNLGPDIPGMPFELNTGDIEVEWSGLDWSRDGKWIAFNDYPKHDENGEYIKNQSIYIVPSGGGTPNKVIENYRDVRIVNYRISLSPTGKNLAFSLIEENKQHIFSTSIENVMPKRLTEMEAREPVFSPDGKYIAFVKDKNKGKGEGDLGLWIIPSEGGTLQLLADAGKASSPIWSPDGKMIAFLDYSQGKLINIIPVSENGKSSGKVIRIDTPEGTEEVRLLAGWTPDNKIGALLVSKLEFGLYTLPAKGGQAAMILNDTRVSQPRWSRDGKQIYYVATPEEGEGRSYRMFLASVSANGGKGTPLQTNIEGKSVKQFAFQSGNRVSPNGKWIVTSTWTSADTNTVNVHWPTSKIWKVSVDRKDAIQITNSPGNFSDMSPCWSPDGENIAFVRFQLEEGKDDIFGGLPKIYSINSAGGEPELLVSISGKYVNSLIWSPNGKMIAYLTKEINEPHTKNLNLYEFEKKESRIIGDITSANANNEMAWSHDSKRIAINDGEGKVIKIIKLADGSIEDIKTGLMDVNIYHLDWSPDGKRFVFGGFNGGEAEFWFLENFLPLEKLYKK